MAAEQDKGGRGICSACGGVLGRDCFNEEDCLMILHSQQRSNDQAADELASLCDLIGIEAREVDPIAAGELWHKSDFRGLVKLMHDRAISAASEAALARREAIEEAVKIANAMAYEYSTASKAT